MRQGDGADLLGASDPRSANIGVIYVAPNDDRQSVLKAIITQDKLGRKQVAVVLPEQNRAFQRPVDFEGLKNMRRGLKTQIVFVAPPGPGPAEFARQRRFPVYSSPESFAQSLRVENQSAFSNGKGLFGRRAKTADESGPGSTAQSAAGNQRSPQRHAPVIIPMPLPEERVPRQPAPVNQVEQNQNVQPQDEPQGGNGAVAGAAVLGGLAAGAGLGALAAHNLAGSSPQPEDEMLAPAVGAPQANNAQPVHAPATDEVDTMPVNSPQGNGAFVPIVAGPPPQAGTASASPPIRRRNTGKNAAVAAGALGATAGAGAGLAAKAPGSGGTSPPPRGNTGGGGGAGGGSRRRRGWPLLLLLLILLTLLLAAGIVFAAPGGVGRLSNIIPGQTVTAKVTITPDSKVVKDTFILTAVTGTPDAAKRQVQARQLTYTTPVQSKTVPATGIKNTPAIQASGTLTFYNGNTYAYTVAAGTKFTDSHGVQVENTSSVTIPAGNPQTGYGHTSAPAIAVVGGTSGNIPANDFNETPCCGSSSVLVYNLAAFSGGQNSQHYTVVQQSDVNGAAGPLKTSQTQNAQKGLSAEIKSNEKLINTPQCSTSVNPNPAVGTKATSVTVSVTATCKGEVYDQQGAKSLAAELLKSEAQKSLGSNYALLNDNVVTQITSASIVDGNGTISLDVNAEGVWVYQFSDAQKQNLAKLIAGKSVSDARTILLQQMGVSDAQITISDGSNTLPTNPSDITIVINPVSGLPGGSPTATLPTPTGTAPVTPTPSLTITPEPGQGSTGGS